jgi:hypothetical protein
MRTHENGILACAHIILMCAHGVRVCANAILMRAHGMRTHENGIHVCGKGVLGCGGGAWGRVKIVVAGVGVGEYDAGEPRRSFLFLTKGNNSMANQMRRIKPELLDADASGLAALQAMTGYAPANQAYTLAAITAAHGALQSAQAAETQAEAAYATARDNAVAREWEFHNLILGAKDQVTAQFGRDSNEVQALGLKKASERRSPQRRSKPGDGGK